MKNKVKILDILSMTFLLLLSVVFIFPFYWILTGAFKSQKVTIKLPHPTMENFEKLFQNPALQWLINSIFIAALTLIIVCIASSMAGYVLAKKRFYGDKLLFSIFVFAMALPKQVILVPLMKLVSFMGIHDTSWAFTNIVMPIVKPGLGALAIFTFINTWNDYFMQLVMLNSRTNLTISLGVATLQQEFSTNYGVIMAGAALAAVPIVAVFLMFQNYFTQGITMGAVKG